MGNSTRGVERVAARTIPILLLLIGTSLGTVIATTDPVGACSCAGPVALEDAVGAADLVFVGTPTAVRDEVRDVGDIGPAPEQVTEFRVDEVVRRSPLVGSGDVPPGATVEVDTGIGGGGCGVDFAVGEAAGVLAYRRAGGWRSSMCDYAGPSPLTPDTLRAAPTRPPPPDGTGPIAFVELGRRSTATMTALDAEGRPLGYVFGPHGRWLAACPDGRRVLAIGNDQRGFGAAEGDLLIDVIDLVGLRLVERRRVPDFVRATGSEGIWSFDGAWCTAEDGGALTLFAPASSGPTATSGPGETAGDPAGRSARLIEVIDGEVEVHDVGRARAFAAAPGDAEGWLLTGPNGRTIERVDLRTVDREPLAELEVHTALHLAATPDGTHLAVAANLVPSTTFPRAVDRLLLVDTADGSIRHVDLQPNRHQEVAALAADDDGSVVVVSHGGPGSVLDIATEWVPPPPLGRPAPPHQLAFAGRGDGPTLAWRNGTGMWAGRSFTKEGSTSLRDTANDANAWAPAAYLALPEEPTPDPAATRRLSPPPDLPSVIGAANPAADASGNPIRVKWAVFAALVGGAAVMAAGVVALSRRRRTR